MALLNPTQQVAITTADKVFEQIQNEIVEGIIPAGSKISEPELSKRFEISRSTLREALNRLEKCHLIERKANVGSRVVQCSIEGLLEIYIVREALEGMACRQAALNMSDLEINEMQAILSEHAKNKDLQDGIAYYQEEGDFSLLLNEQGLYLVDTKNRRFLFNDLARSPSGFFRKDILSLNTIIYSDFIRMRKVYSKKMAEFGEMKAHAKTQEEKDYAHSMYNIFSCDFMTTYILIS